ncbi:AAA family ATPase [Patescibacteria group bacterium]
MKQKLIILMGLPGSGKTTLGNLLESRHNNFVHISPLKVQRKMGLKRYNRKRAKEMESMFFKEASNTLRRNQNLILENVFSRREYKNNVLKFSQDNYLDTLIIETLTPENIAKKRIRKRPKKDHLICDSNDPKHYDKSLARWESLEINLRDYPRLSYFKFFNDDNPDKSYIETVNIPTNAYKFVKQIQKAIIKNFKVQKVISSSDISTLNQSFGLLLEI